jgi:pantothenate kinase-related protein Tda10
MSSERGSILATVPADLALTHVPTIERESRKVLLDNASNEFVFGVVGHAGAGTSFFAVQLENLLK